MRLRPRGAASLAVGALAAASVGAYLRVLSGAGWLARALVAAVLPMAIVAGLRRAGLRRWAAAAVTLACGAVYAAAALMPRGLPAAGLEGSLRVLAREMVAAVAAIDVTFTPAPAGAGLVGLLVCAAWAGGTWSAVALGGRVPVAGLPWLALFLFAAAVGAGDQHLRFTVPFLASFLAVLYTEAWLLAETRATAAGIARVELEPGQAGPPGLRPAVATGAAALVLAVAAPSLASGYLEGGPRIGEGTPDTTVVSPIVQILPRLNARRPAVMFGVEAGRPAYWRLTALDRFDGNAWSATGRYSTVEGGIELQDPPGARVATLQQTFSIAGLGGIWVPAAYAPSGLTGLEVTLDPVRATVATRELRRGERYTVVSQTPAPTAEALRQAGTRGAPPGNTELPADLPAVIGQMAASITKSAHTPYAKALAIQSFLRGFEYRQDLPPGHSSNYLVRFLTEIRAGYCEQFAGSMAVMLRTLGIPARVAVGFLPGRAAGSGFVVSNEDAHAWPEVWFAGVGWVPFEPTPRSGVDPPAFATPPAGTVQPGASPAPTPVPPTDGAGTTSRQPALDAPPPEPASTPGAGSPGLPGWAAGALTTAGMAVLLMGARAVRLRSWAWLRGSSPRRVHGAWNELLLRGADAWRPRRRAETEQEYARAMVDALGIDYAVMQPLVASRQRVAYAPRPVGDEEARAAAAAMQGLRRALFRSAGWTARVRLLLSPRPLLVRDP